MQRGGHYVEHRIMATVQIELSAFQGPEYLSQNLGILVNFLLVFRHDALLSAKGRSFISSENFLDMF